MSVEKTVIRLDEPPSVSPQSQAEDKTALTAAQQAALYYARKRRRVANAENTA